ncbi:MAG: hypothetical protein WDW38_004460 [Sanguina aurantia]
MHANCLPSESEWDRLHNEVLAAKVDEEESRNRREEAEQQLFRAEQADALRRQQAQEASTSGRGSGGSTGSSIMGAGMIGPRKKTVGKKSTRMAAMAAGAGLLRVNSPTSRSPLPSTAPSNSSLRTTGNSMQEAGDSRSQGRSTTADPVQTSDPTDFLNYGFPAMELERASPTIPDSSGPEGEGSSRPVPVASKPIFIISDCTGESAARTVRAALNQFEVRCQTAMPATLLIFRFVEDQDRLHKIITDAAKENALVVYTFVDPKMIQVVQSACHLYAVRCVDLWTTLLDNMEGHLNTARSGIPMTSNTRSNAPSLTADYFKMIEAVEYTRRLDDGANAREWKHADLLILGVSRCGKTPLSIYLGQRGYKVANLPLVPGCPIPKELYEIDQTRIVGLTIDPHVLSTIRRNRLGMMGLKQMTGISNVEYAELKKVNEELEWARALFRRNPGWPVLDVTLRGIEETAGRILKLLNDRRGDSSPQWVEELHRSHAATAAAASAAAGEVDGAPARPVPEQSGVYSSEHFLMQGLY